MMDALRRLMWFFGFLWFLASAAGMLGRGHEMLSLALGFCVCFAFDKMFGPLEKQNERRRW